MKALHSFLAALQDTGLAVGRQEGALLTSHVPKGDSPLFALHGHVRDAKSHVVMQMEVSLILLSHS